MTGLSFVHRFVRGSSADKPVLLLLHGTGGDENDLLPIGQSLLEGATLLSPRGQVLEHGMPRFFRRLAEGVFDIPDLTRRTHDLAAFLAAAREEYGITQKIIAVGYSNGANIAASLMLLHPDALASAVLLRAMVPFEPDDEPQLAGVPVLLAAGRNDPIATPDHTRRLNEILSDAGAEVSVHWHPGGHQLGQDDLVAARRWLASR